MLLLWQGRARLSDSSDHRLGACKAFLEIHTLLLPRRSIIVELRTSDGPLIRETSNPTSLGRLHGAGRRNNGGNKRRQSVMFRVRTSFNPEHRRENIRGFVILFCLRFYHGTRDACLELSFPRSKSARFLGQKNLHDNPVGKPSTQAKQGPERLLPLCKTRVKRTTSYHREVFVYPFDSISR